MTYLWRKWYCELLFCRDKETRQWPINLCTSPMMIHNQWLKRLDTQQNEPRIKVPMVLKPTNKKTLLKEFNVF